MSASEATASGVGPLVRTLTGRRTVVLLTLAGAGLVLLAGTRTWATVTVSGALPGLAELTVPGRRSAPAAIPIALAAAAGAIVLVTSGRLVRHLVGAGLVIAGAVVVLAGVSGGVDTGAAAASAVRDGLGVVTGPGLSGDGGVNAVLGAGGAQVAVTIWPWVAAVGAAVLVLAGLLTLAGSRFWSGPTRRYERPVAPGVATSGAGSPAGGRAAGGSAAGREQNPAGTWDALSRGEDPTSSPDDPT